MCTVSASLTAQPPSQLDSRGSPRSSHGLMLPSTDIESESSLVRSCIYHVNNGAKNTLIRICSLVTPLILTAHLTRQSAEPSSDVGEVAQSVILDAVAEGKCGVATT